MAVVACLGMLAGCGIGSGRVRIEGKPAGADQLGADSAVRDKLGRPDNVTQAIDLVRRFLTAPADDVNVRVQTVSSYISPDESFLPKDEVHVVHVDGGYNQFSDASGNTTVEVDVHHIGILNNFGRIEPSERGAEKLKFTVVDRPDGLFLSKLSHDVLLMSDSALNSYFQARRLYFWSKDGTQLIPDLRYVTLRQNAAGQADLLLQWLYEGPSPWLAPAVADLPSPTRPAGKRVSVKDGSLSVDLATAPGPEDGGRLAKQLAKTLLTASVSKLELTVAGVPQGDTTRPDDQRHEASERFGIVNGAVRRVAPGNTTGLTPPNPAPVTLPADLNKNLVAVAFARGQQSAVLVRQDGGVSVWHQQSGLTPVQLGQAKPLGQPVWLDRAATSALILADNRLYHIGPKGVATPVSGAENITAFSLAPDDTRLALVRNGRLWLAALTRTASNDLILNQPQVVPTLLGNGVQNVAFGGETTLVVAGPYATKITLVSANLDGFAPSSYRHDLFDPDVRVVHMASAPNAAPLFEVTGNGSFEAQVGGSQQLVPVGASPSAEVAGAKVSAPSFEG